MRKRNHLPVGDELVDALGRVVNGKQSETLYDTSGTPVAILIPVTEPARPTAREQFLQQLRAWRDGDPEEQRREWEQLQQVLAEERLPEQPA